MERIVDKYMRKLLMGSSWMRHCIFWMMFFSLNILSVGQYLHTAKGLISFGGFSILNMLVFYSSYFLYLISKKYGSIILFVIGSLLGGPLLFCWLAIKWYFLII
jgi:hypothetical protein